MGQGYRVPTVDVGVHKQILLSALSQARRSSTAESTAERATRYRFYAAEAERYAQTGPTLAHRYYYAAVAAEWRALADEIEARRTPRH